MKIILTTILLACSGLLYAQNEVKLDSRAKVTFPGKTEQMSGATSPIIYSTLDRDNKVTGMATVIDAEQFGVDSATIAANYNNTMFIDLILQSLTGQYPGVAIVSRRKISEQGKMGYEVTLQNEKPDDSVPYKNIYTRFFFAGAHIYALTVLAGDGVDATTERDRFFSSLILN